MLKAPRILVSIFCLAVSRLMVTFQCSFFCTGKENQNLRGAILPSYCPGKKENLIKSPLLWVQAQYFHPLNMVIFISFAIVLQKKPLPKLEEKRIKLRNILISEHLPQEADLEVADSEL